MIMHPDDPTDRIIISPQFEHRPTPTTDRVAMLGAMHTREEIVMNNTLSIKSRIVFTLAIIAVCLLQIGCTDLQGALSQASSWQNHAKEVRADLQVQHDELVVMRQTIEDDSPNADNIDSSITNAQTNLRLLDSVITQSEMIIQEANNPTGTLTQMTNAISPWIPAPAQGPAVLGAALIATLLRSRNLKINMNSIIQSIDHLTRNDQDFEKIFKKHADTVRTIQTPGARKMIHSTIQRSQRPAATL